MIKINSETLELIEDIKQVNVYAFGRENESRLVDAIRQSQEFVKELSLVAVDDSGKVQGHILFSKAYIETTKGKQLTIVLAPMAVLPENQGKGIGSLLVEEGLQKCKQLGYEHVIVLGHPWFYPKFGFKRASDFGISPPFSVPDEVFMAVELIPGSLNGHVGILKYPTAFHLV